MLGQEVVNEAPAWMSFTVVALAGLVLYTIVNLISFLRAQEWNGVLKIVLSFVAGFLFVWWLSETEMTENFVLITDGPALKDLDFGGMLMLAVGIGSVAPVVADFRKAWDRSDSSAEPPLIGSGEPPADNSFE